MGLDVAAYWIPAFAGMTMGGALPSHEPATP
jgi:hypothetical protein